MVRRTTGCGTCRSSRWSRTCASLRRVTQRACVSCSARRCGGPPDLRRCGSPRRASPTPTSPPSTGSAAWTCCAATTTPTCCLSRSVRSRPWSSRSPGGCVPRASASRWSTRAGCCPSTRRCPRSPRPMASSRSSRTTGASVRSATRSHVSYGSATSVSRCAPLRCLSGSSRSASGRRSSPRRVSPHRTSPARSSKWLPGRTRRLFADRLPAKISVSVVYVLALFMTIMDTTIVNVALPQLGSSFGVPAAHVNTVVVGYLVSLAVFIPVSGWLGDRFGMRRVFLAALLFFTVASALCGLAQSLTQLVLFRILQGVGGGLLTPVGLAMLYRTFPAHERIRASRILVVPIAFAPAIGPVVGGLLVTDLSWRWAFYVNVPIGIIGVLFGLLFVREQRQEDPGRFDVPGFLLAGLGLGALMFALSDGPSRGWTSPAIVVAGVVGALLLVAMVLVERRTAQPMLDLRLLANKLFSSTTTVLVLGTTGFLGSLFLVALFFQDGFGVSALQSGLSTFPEALGVMVGAQIAGRLYPRVGPRRIMTAGLCAVTLMLSLIALVPFSASLWVMRVLMVFLGLSMAHVFVPAQAAAFATVSSAATARASTMFNAGRQLGGAVGVAVLSTVISAVGVTRSEHGHAVPNATAYHLAFFTAAAIELLAAVLALRIDDDEAAPSMRRVTAERTPERLSEVVA